MVCGAIPTGGCDHPDDLFHMGACIWRGKSLHRDKQYVFASSRAEAKARACAELYSNRPILAPQDKEVSQMVSSGIQGQINYHLNQVRHLEKRAAIEESLRAVMDAEWDDETTLLFKRNFGNGRGGLQYTYVAVMIKGYWYITGRSRDGYKISTYTFVEDWLVPAMEETGEVWVVSEWVRVQ